MPVCTYGRHPILGISYCRNTNPVETPRQSTHFFADIDKLSQIGARQWTILVVDEVKRIPG